MSNVKLTIEEMRAIAEERDGLCLSDTYVNGHTHLLWECAMGHQWHAIPGSVKRGTW
ncbi:putative phosphodiesterase [Oxalobacteraceae bacterium GrIS 1.11]